MITREQVLLLVIAVAAAADVGLILGYFIRSRYVAQETVLRDIRTVVAKQRSLNAPLWDILTALRGPDDGDNNVKAATTGVIRHAVCGYDCPGMVNRDSKYEKHVRESLPDNHFTRHAVGAFRALGLKWHEVNK